MSDLREVFEMTVKQMGEPDLDSWQEQEKRQRTAARNRKIGAIVVAAMITIALVVIGLSSLGRDDGEPIDSVTPPAGRSLSVVDVGSGDATSLTVPAGASDFDVSPDGSMVAFAAEGEDGNPQVFVMDVDGSDVRQLTKGEGGTCAVAVPGVGNHCSLDWSPDASMIAFQRETSQGPQIFTVRVGDGATTMVTDEPEGAVDPGGWSPDGGSLVFSMPDVSIGHYTAQSLDLATGEVALIVTDGSTPKLSPDGSLIAFNSWTATSFIRLFVANSDGSDRRVIARLNGDDGYQEWSPDGSKIAFIADLGKDGPRTFVHDLESDTTRFVAAGTIESWIDNDHILVS